MKTIKEWFEEYLPEDIRKKAIANSNRLSSKTNTFRDALLGSFIFSASTEGHKYWEDVLVKYSQKLENIDPLEFKPEDPFE